MERFLAVGGVVASLGRFYVDAPVAIDQLGINGSAELAACVLEVETLGGEVRGLIESAVTSESDAMRTQRPQSFPPGR